MVGYFEGGPNFVTMAMNGWGEAEPAWWLNLQAYPAVRTHLVDRSITVIAGHRPLARSPREGSDHPPRRRKPLLARGPTRGDR